MFCVLFFIFSAITVLFFALKIYSKLTTGWCKSQKCLVGKTAIVTGANTGIGYNTALDFAKRGARVILACRDEAKAKEAQNSIIEETNNPNVVVRLINMNSFASVRAFAKKINDEEGRLDILVNNAGAGGLGDKKSKDGHVLLLQVNYFSPFLLTNLLIGLLKKTKKSRIVNVSSIGAKWAKDFDVNKLDKFPGVMSDYLYSKLCNILFTIELAKKLDGSGVTAYSLHPGAVSTEIFRKTTGFSKLIFDFLKNYLFKTSEEGAQTTIYCSLAEGIEKYNGEHFADCRRVAPYKTVVQDVGLASRLWKATENLIQVEPGEIQI